MIPNLLASRKVSEVCHCQYPDNGNPIESRESENEI